MNSIQQAAILILAGGGAAGIYTLVKALILYRNSADTREATAIGNLEKWRNQADARAEYFEKKWDFERTLVEFWRRRAGLLEYLSTSRGVEIPPLDPIPRPSNELIQPPPPTSEGSKHG